MTLDGKRDGLDALKLGNELTTRRYLFHKIPVSKVLNVPEYIAMRMIMHTDEAEDIYDGKTYLKDIAEMMQKGNRRGAEELKNAIHRYKNAGIYATELAKDVIDFEEKNLK